MEKINLKTHTRQELIDITDDVKEIIHSSKIEDGICIIFCTHTTAGLIINSNRDPLTAKDLVEELDRIVPTRTDFNHIFDTPSDASGHIKASLVGDQLTLIINNGEMVIGDSQGILFWEFDGPRKRTVLVKVVES